MNGGRDLIISVIITLVTPSVEKPQVTRSRNRWFCERLREE